MVFALVGLAYLLLFACGIAHLVFFIMVLIQMFKRDQSNLGIICIVLTFCTGVGPLIAFVYGWIKSTEWNLKKVMTYWTAAIALIFVAGGLLLVSIFMAAATIDPNQFSPDPNAMEFEFEMDDSQFNFEGDFNMPDDSTMPDEAAIPEGFDLPTDAAAPELPEEGSTDQP